MGRSGFGLNDLLGGAALGAGGPANTTPQSPPPAETVPARGDRRLTLKAQGDVQPKMAPQ